MHIHNPRLFFGAASCAPWAAEATGKELLRLEKTHLPLHFISHFPMLISSHCLCFLKDILLYMHQLKEALFVFTSIRSTLAISQPQAKVAVGVVWKEHATSPVA